MNDVKKDKIANALNIDEDDDDDYPEEESYEDDEKRRKKHVPRKATIWVRSFLHNDLYDIKDVESNGDCLFAVVREGFKDIGRHVKVNKWKWSFNRICHFKRVFKY